MGNIQLNLFQTLRPTAMISAALVAILALTFYLRVLFFGQYIDADVGNAAYMGWRMAEGEVLIDLEGPGKPPLYPMLYALFVLLFGPSVLGLKMFGALFVLMAVLAIYWVAETAYGKHVGLLAALLFGVFSSGPMVEGGTVNLETLLHFPSILAIGFFLRGATTGQLKWYFLAGFWGAMATLVKQVGGVLFFVFLLCGFNRDWKVKEWFSRYSLIGIGALLPLLGMILFYSSHGYSLRELYDSMLGSNFRYIQKGHESSEMVTFFFSSLKVIFFENSLLWIGTSFTAGLFISRWMRGRGEMADRVFLWWALWSFFAVWISGTFYAHYFLQIISPFSLLTAHAILWVWEYGKTISSLPKRRVFQGAWLLCLGISTFLFIKTDYKYFFKYSAAEQTAYQFKGLEGVYDSYGYGLYNLIQHEIASYIRKHTEPSDTLYVWGVAPQVYFLAQRRAATVYRNNFNLSQNVTQNADEALRTYSDKVMKELSLSPPTYILKIFNLEAFPKLKDFITMHYQIDKNVDEIFIHPFRIRLYRKVAGTKGTNGIRKEIKKSIDRG